jgi:PAS domain S-box-containing protein
MVKIVFALILLAGVVFPPFASVALISVAIWVTFRYPFSNITPMARVVAMESMPDAALIFDAKGRMVDLNRAAKRLFGIDKVTQQQAIAQLFAEWPELATGIGCSDEQQMCLTIQANPPLSLDVHLSPLHGLGGKFQGQVLILHDITAQKAAEQRYRQLLDGNPLGMTVVETATGIIVYANQKAADLVGMTREQALGTLANSYYSNRADREQLMALLAKQGSVGDFEVRLKAASGQTIWCLVTAIPTVYDGKQCHVSSLLDITTRRQAEEALRLSDERLRLATLAASLGVWDWDLRTDKIVWNDTLFDLYGLPKDTPAPYEMCKCLVLPEDRPKLDMLLQKVISEQTASSTEYRIIRPDGALRWIHSTKSAVLDDNGQVIRLVGIHSDITERKEAEEVLRAKAQTKAIEWQQRAILEHLPVGVILTSGPEHKLIYQNPCFSEMFGYMAEQIPDLAHWMRLAYPNPEQAQPTEERYKHPDTEDTEEAEYGPVEVSITARDGTVKQVGVHFSVTSNLYYITFIDLTERHQAEKARRERDAAEAASEAKSRFLANMSHEIRTPLNAILGFAQVLERDAQLDASQRSKLTTIRRSGEHLLELINDILDMAKIEAGRMVLRRHPFDLNLLIKDLDALFRQRALERGLILIVDARGLYGIVEGDEMRLRQVLINLLSNAIKFTSSGAVTLRVQARPDDGIQFSVADTGVGIAPEEMARLFEPFTQTASGRKTQEGTGPGLALSRQFVRFMGGELNVRSIPSVGSEFFFTLPLHQLTSDELPTRQGIQATLGLEPGQASCRILIADDQPSHRTPLRALLASLNPMPPVLEFREAENTQAILDVWEVWQPHLAFLDLRMPGIVEERTICLLKERIAARPNAIQTVLVALNASGFNEESQQLLACGCDEFARKPFRAEEIFAILRRRTALRFIQAAEPYLPAMALSQEDIIARLQQCAVTWRHRLKAALDRGDSTRIAKLIAQLEEQDEQLHEVLAKWAYDCDHDVLLDLLGMIPD